jgi:hypothetical protein
MLADLLLALVSYSLYVGAAGVAEDSLGRIFSDSLKSPAGVALQLAMVAALVALLRVDSAGVLERRRRDAATGETAGGDAAEPRSEVGEGLTRGEQDGVTGSPARRVATGSSRTLTERSPRSLARRPAASREVGRARA